MENIFLSIVEVGDTVTRCIGGEVHIPLTVTEITEQRIICGAWEFDKQTGEEIDEELGWGVGHTGSFIEAPGTNTI